jgi:hypothetical protein
MGATMIIKLFEDFSTKYTAAVTATERAAQARGFGELVPDSTLLRIAESWRFAIDAFDLVAREVEAHAVQAGVFVGVGGEFSAKVEGIKTRIADAVKKDIAARREAADRNFRP